MEHQVIQAHRGQYLHCGDMDLEVQMAKTIIAGQEAQESR